MNGYSSRQTPPYAAYHGQTGPGGRSGRDGLPTPAASLAPSPVSKRLVDNYRKDIMTAFEAERPRFNPMNATRMQSSALVDLNDPIQVHLLTETALLDSKRYEILSQEEVDTLKKQCHSLSQRIDQTRANLTIQSKYRDAAISMSKLYSPARPESRRRSLLNRSSGGSDSSAREAEAERAASERRCEELATELFNLEKRIMGPQRRLLEHTAGILQLTHRVSSRRRPNDMGPPGGIGINGMPGSPESMYTVSNERDEDFLDPDDSPATAAAARPRPNAIEIPMRSPIREQTRELREESDRLRDENQRLLREVQALRQETTQQPQLPPGTDERMQDLSQLVQQAVVAADPDKYGGFRGPSGGGHFEDQLEYLEAGLETLRMAQSESRANTNKTGASAAPSAQAMRQADDLNMQLTGLLSMVNPDYPGPEPRAADLEGKLAEVEGLLRIVQGQAIQAIDGARLAAGESSEDVEHLLRGLFGSIQNSLVEAKRRREQRKAAGQLDDDVSGDEMMDTEEEYSLPAFASKVRYITTKASDLREQKTVLHRQIRQQRELNSKLTTDTEADLMKMQEELQHARSQLEQAQKDAADANVRLSDALRDAETAQSARAVGESAALKDAEAKLAERNAAIGALEAQCKELQSRLGQLEPAVEELTAKLASAESKASSLSGQLSDTVEAKRFVEGELEAKLQELDAKRAEFDAKLANSQGDSKASTEKDDEIERLNVMVVELKTELTFAQAELDGAYGSRAERAKEAAAFKNNGEVARLQGQVRDLKTQLSQTVEELETITKETLGAERDKVELEAKLDDAVAVKSTLEAEADGLRKRLGQELDEARAATNKLQEELDSERLKVLAASTQTAGRRTGAGASMLSEQFRSTMREERKKFQEDMRKEQAERRKVEEQLSKLKREMASK